MVTYGTNNVFINLTRYAIKGHVIIVFIKVIDSCVVGRWHLE